jgi:hypothetical protein
MLQTEGDKQKNNYLNVEIATCFNLAPDYLKRKEIFLLTNITALSLHRTRQFGVTN